MKHVLIVDDEPSVARVLKLTLEKAGWQVTWAPDGQVALEWLRKATEPPTDVITDIQMPRMNGRELVGAIEAEWPARDYPIYVMTSMTEREERHWVGALHRVHFLEKPLSPRLLVATLAHEAVTGFGDFHG